MDGVCTHTRLANVPDYSNWHKEGEAPELMLGSTDSRHPTKFNDIPSNFFTIPLSQQNHLTMLFIKQLHLSNLRLNSIIVQKRIDLHKRTY